MALVSHQSSSKEKTASWPNSVGWGETQGLYNRFEFFYYCVMSFAYVMFLIILNNVTISDLQLWDSTRAKVNCVPQNM